MVSKNLICDGEVLSPGSAAKDWESDELVCLLSLLTKSVNHESCIYLLEILDTLWDDCYSDKTTGLYNFKSNGDGRPFKSSFVNSICSVQWAVSNMDHKLHYPEELFHDCDAVRSILGASAPYVVPKVSLMHHVYTNAGHRDYLFVCDVCGSHCSLMLAKYHKLSYL